MIVDGTSYTTNSGSLGRGEELDSSLERLYTIADYIRNKCLHVPYTYKSPENDISATYGVLPYSMMSSTTVLPFLRFVGDLYDVVKVSGHGL